VSKKIKILRKKYKVKIKYYIKIYENIYKNCENQVYIIKNKKVTTTGSKIIKKNGKITN